MPLAATAALTRKTVSATEIPVALTVFPIALTVSPVRRVGETGTTSEGSRGSPGGVPGDMNVAPTKDVASANPAAFRAAIPPVFLFAARR